MFLKSKFLLRKAANNGSAAFIARSTVPSLQPTGLKPALAATQHTSNLFTYPFFNKFGFATRSSGGSNGH